MRSGRSRPASYAMTIARSKHGWPRAMFGRDTGICASSTSTFSPAAAAIRPSQPSLTASSSTNDFVAATPPRRSAFWPWSWRRSDVEIWPPGCWPDSPRPATISVFTGCSTSISRIEPGFAARSRPSWWPIRGPRRRSGVASLTRPGATSLSHARSPTDRSSFSLDHL